MGFGGVGLHLKMDHVSQTCIHTAELINIWDDSPLRTMVGAPDFTVIFEPANNKQMLNCESTRLPRLANAYDKEILPEDDEKSMHKDIVEMLALNVMKYS